MMAQGGDSSSVAVGAALAVLLDQLLSDALDEHVTAHGVVVVVNARHFTIRQQPCDVQLIEKQRLRRWLLCIPIVYDQGLVEALFEVARQSSTWRT